MLADGRSERRALPEGEVTLAALSPVAAGAEPRGAQEPLRALFAQPFGPRALAAFQSEQLQAPAAVYGISREDSERMSLLLGQLGQQQRQRRRFDGALRLAGGAAFGLAGALNHRAGDYKASTWTYLGAGALLAGAGTWSLLSSTEGEEVEADYRRRLSLNEDPALLVASTEERLRRIAATDVFDYLAERPLIELEKIGDSAPEPLPAWGTHPLSGVRALGKGHVIAGAGIGRSLASLGADCLNVWRVMEWEKDPLLVTANAHAARHLSRRH